MPNFFYFDQNGQKQGPVDGQQLRTLAAQGIITPESPLETESGHTGRAGKIKGLFSENPTASVPPPAQQNEHANTAVPVPIPFPTKENDTPPDSPPEGFLSKAYANAKIAAAIVAQQAVIKKLQMMTLPTAFAKLGNVVYSSQIGQEQFTEVYQTIHSIRERMTARLAAQSTPGEVLTLSERAARLATDTKNKVAQEKDKFETNKKLFELGKLFFESPLVEEYPELAPEINGVREVLASLAEGQQKCQDLQVTGHPGFRKKLVVAACVVMVLIGGYCQWGFLTPSPEAQQARAETKSIEVETKGFQTEMKQESQREEKQNRKQEEHERTREQERLPVKKQVDSEKQSEKERQQRQQEAAQRVEEKRFAEEHAGDRKVLTIKGVEYAFRWCPAGTFTMGSPSNEKGRDNDETPHQVRLTKGFWMLETEVTLEMWEVVMGRNPSHFKGVKLPVEQVSWDDCQDFIKRLNNTSGAAPSGFKFSLPTEAQWEYACRAGTTTPFHFGGVLNGDKANCDGSYPYGTETKGPYLQKTTPIGSYAANAWGLYDMHGNVWEWCSDWKGDYPSGSVTDPIGPSSGTSRVSRGGSWSYDAGSCRSAYRDGLGPSFRLSFLGLRLSLVSESRAEEERLPANNQVDSEKQAVPSTQKTTERVPDKRNTQPESNKQNGPTSSAQKGRSFYERQYGKDGADILLQNIAAYPNHRKILELNMAINGYQLGPKKTCESSVTLILTENHAGKTPEAIYQSFVDVLKMTGFDTRKIKENAEGHIYIDR